MLPAGVVFLKEREFCVDNILPDIKDNSAVGTAMLYFMAYEGGNFRTVWVSLFCLKSWMVSDTQVPPWFHAFCSRVCNNTDVQRYLVSEAQSQVKEVTGHTRGGASLSSLFLEGDGKVLVYIQGTITITCDWLSVCGKHLAGSWCQVLLQGLSMNLLPLNFCCKLKNLRLSPHLPNAKCASSSAWVSLVLLRSLG